MPPNLLFFFSALGAFNGILVAAWLMLGARPRSASNRLLGAFLLMLSLRVGKSVFFYFDHDLARGYLQLGLTACAFIGPFLYLYVRSVRGRYTTRLGRWHLLPLLAIALLTTTLFPYQAHPEAWNPTIVRCIYAIWLGYTLAAAYELRGLFRRLTAKRSEGTQRLTAFEGWLLVLVASNVVIVALYSLVGFVSYLSGAFAFTLLLYVAWSQLLMQRLRLAPKPVPATSDKYAGTALDPALQTRIHRALTAAMQEDQLYTNADLRLGALAERCGTTTHLLSQYLNEQLGQTFTNYVNGHRIEHAKTLIVKLDHLTLEAIGMACGFNSRSTFYAAFKRAVGTTPAQYKRARTASDTGVGSSSH